MFMLIGVGVSCRISYSIVGYSYVRFSESITPVREDGPNFSDIVYM